MNGLLKRSFQGRLFVGFLLVGLIPFLVCSISLVQVFRLRLSDNSRQRDEEMLSCVLDSMDSVMDAFDQAVRNVQSSRVIRRALAGEVMDAARVYGALYTSVDAAQGFARFDLCDKDGVRRYSTFEQTEADEKLNVHWGALYAAEQSGALRFSACEDLELTDQPLMQGAAPIYGPDGERAGYVLVSVYSDNLHLALDGKYGTQGSLMLLSPYWRPVYGDRPAATAQLAPKLRERLLAGQGFEGISEDSAYIVKAHERSGLYVVLQRPVTFTDAALRQAYIVSGALAMACVILSLVLSYALSRQLALPVSRLTQAMGEVESNNLEVQVAPVGEDELGKLTALFNHTVAALKRNQDELVENQRVLNETQIRMLQAQLNPHFLGNTLDTIKWMAKINHVPEIAVMATDLADVLRFCISSEEFVTLAYDVEVLQRYVEIQEIRLSGRLEFSVDIPPELEECLVPKMILQPIVENAVLHGLAGVQEGKILLTAREERGLLLLSVADNGPGFPEEIAERRYQREDGAKGGVGLYNVDTILEKYYGGNCGLYLRNGLDGQGAVVTAALPIKREGS